MTKHAVEARVHRRLDNAGGVFVTFQIHTDDTKDVDGVRVGDTVMLAWEDIVNVKVEKIEVSGNRAAQGGISAVANRAETPREPKPRRKFEDLSAPEQAGILSNDLEFQLFASSASSRWPVSDVYTAADFIRETCQVKSRADISPDNPHWQCLLNNFRKWQTDQRYADVRR